MSRSAVYHVDTVFASGPMADFCVQEFAKALADATYTIERLPDGRFRHTYRFGEPDATLPLRPPEAPTECEPVL